MTGLSAVIPDAVAFAALEQVSKRTMRLNARPFTGFDVSANVAARSGRVARLVLAEERNDDDLEEQLLNLAAYCADAAARLARKRRDERRHMAVD